MQKQLLRELLVKGRMIGEHLKFSLKGRPSASEAILLVGSGRSGTTWLASILAASPGVQLIFEPLNPKWIKDVQRLTGWDDTPLLTRSFYLHPEQDFREWKEFLNNVLTGGVRCHWTDYERTSYFPNRFLIKEIRANMMQGYIYDNFQPQIIYMRRHPCAVVYSRLAMHWKADVADILQQEALVETHLRPWVGAIEKEHDRLGRQAVWWAVENLVASQELSVRPHHFVTYETFCLEPQPQVQKIFDWLGLDLPPKLQTLINRPSVHSRQDVSYKSTVERLSYWQKQLTREEQGRILGWAHRLGLTDYSDQILPLPKQTSTF